MQRRIGTAAIVSTLAVAAARVLAAAHVGEGAMTLLLWPGLVAGAWMDEAVVDVNASLSVWGLVLMYGVNLVLYGGLLYLVLGWAPALKRRGFPAKKAEKAWA